MKNLICVLKSCRSYRLCFRFSEPTPKLGLPSICASKLQRYILMDEPKRMVCFKWQQDQISCGRGAFFCFSACVEQDRAATRWATWAWVQLVLRRCDDDWTRYLKGEVDLCGCYCLMNKQTLRRRAKKDLIRIARALWNSSAAQLMQKTDWCTDKTRLENVSAPGKNGAKTSSLTA